MATLIRKSMILIKRSNYKMGKLTIFKSPRNSGVQRRNIGDSPFNLSGLSGPSSQVLKWKIRVLKTGSRENGPAHGSESLGRPKRRNWKNCGGKYVRARLEPFPFKLARSSSFRPARTLKGKRSKILGQFQEFPERKIKFQELKYTNPAKD